MWRHFGCQEVQARWSLQKNVDARFGLILQQKQKKPLVSLVWDSYHILLTDQIWLPVISNCLDLSKNFGVEKSF